VQNCSDDAEQIELLRNSETKQCQERPLWMSGRYLYLCGQENSPSTRPIPLYRLPRLPRAGSCLNIRNLLLRLRAGGSLAAGSRTRRQREEEN
jgi:hypothetical protein